VHCRFAHPVDVFAQGAWLVLLVLAPWLYGGTRDWSVDCLNAIGALGVSAWVLACGLRRQWPQVPLTLVGLLLGLLAYGWWMALNPVLVYREDYFTFLEVRPRFAWSPGAVDGATACRMMARITVLAGGILLVTHYSASRAFRGRIWRTAALVGASVACLGWLQKVFQHPVLLCAPEEFSWTHFAAYRYHANAGAYLNLVWPLAAGLAVCSFEERREARSRALWVGVSALSFLAIFLNVSKAALVVSAGIAVAMAVWAWRRLERRGVLRGGFHLKIAGAALLAGAGLMAAMTPWQRWRQLAELSAQMPNERWLAYEVSWKMLRESGWFGWGAGTWALSFPFFSGDQGARIPGIWLFAHEDYLQVLVEWGLLGGLGWAMVMFGGFLKASLRARKRDGSQTPAERALAFVIALALAGVLAHALVDFPLQIASIQIYVATYLGLAWGGSRPGDASAAAIRPMDAGAPLPHP
jgi:O-antigen ligase